MVTTDNLSILCMVLVTSIDSYPKLLITSFDPASIQDKKADIIYLELSSLVSFGSK